MIQIIGSEIISNLSDLIFIFEVSIKMNVNLFLRSRSYHRDPISIKWIKSDGMGISRTQDEESKRKYFNIDIVFHQRNDFSYVEMTLTKHIDILLNFILFNFWLLFFQIRVRRIRLRNSVNCGHPLWFHLIISLRHHWFLILKIIKNR